MIRKIPKKIKAIILINSNNDFPNFLNGVRIFLVTLGIKGRNKGLNSKILRRINTILILIRIPKKINLMSEIIQVDRVLKVNNKVIMKRRNNIIRIPKMALGTSLRIQVQNQKINGRNNLMKRQKQIRKKQKEKQLILDNRQIKIRGILLKSRKKTFKNF